MTKSSATRQMIRETVRRHRGEEPSGKRRWLRRTVQALSLLLLPTGLLLWWGGFFAPPAAVAELQTLVDGEVARLSRMARNEIPYDSGRTDMGDLFQKIRDVPDPYRDQVRQQMGRLFSARERASVGSYFALPPDQRKAELDRRIKAEEARRQQWAAERASRAPSDRQPNAAPSSRAPSDRQPNTPTSATRPQDRSQGTAANAGPRGRGRPRTEESRNEWMKRRIDASSPEERARQTEYRRAMTERREQLGLSPGRGGPGRRPG